MICLHCGNRCHEVGENSFQCSVCHKDFEQCAWDFELEETEDLPRGECGELKIFQVTELNISSVPVDWLYARYQRLQKGTKTKTSPALLQELEIIQRHLDKSGKSICNEFQSPEVEQIELNIPIAIRQQYVSIVEYRLKEYYQLTKRKKWLEIEVRQLRPQGAGGPSSH